MTPINLFDIRLNGGGETPLSFPAHENTLALVMQSEVEISGQPARAGDLAVFKNEGEAITVRAVQAAQLLLLNGEPIDEPVVQYGPFVMNTEAEIRAAMKDFGSGKFGQLAD